MARTVWKSLFLVVLAIAAWPGAASAAEPPWCGTPEADYSADVLADGTDPADPAGSFPHIPHYAIGCTLEDIEDRSNGTMDVRRNGAYAAYFEKDGSATLVDSASLRGRRPWAAEGAVDAAPSPERLQ